MNGTTVASEKSPANLSDADNSNPFIVGGMMDAGGVTATFLGELDDLRLFRRACRRKKSPICSRATAMRVFSKAKAV